ncbi:MAG: DUF47 domain-containing protein [Promethearchaeota archaeon]|jgi:uncharacterized protein Yka (UPF0111/DUF47 family)
MQKIKEQILTMLIEHCRIISSVISDMSVYYSSWAKDFKANKKDLEKKKIKMQMSEEEADEIKIKLIKQFSEAGAQGLGDYISLILRMDNVINYAIEFVDILAFIDSDINENLKKRYEKLLNKILEMSDALKSTIKGLRDKPDVVFDRTTMIHEIENDIDKIYREFLNHLYDNKDLDIRKLLRIRDSINMLEQLADRIHDIADIIRVLLYQ